MSGFPGVGKTTSATLVCEELGFTYTEMNASDTQSKKNLGRTHFSLTEQLNHGWPSDRLSNFCKIWNYFIDIIKDASFILLSY